MAGDAPRFLLYSHDGCGLGHLRRNLHLGAALIDAHPGAAVLLAAGADGVASLPVPDGVDVLALPALRKVANGRYEARRLAVSAEHMAALRAGLLVAAVDAFRPAVLVADKHPRGAGGELAPALSLARAGGCRTTLGLRDVLDDPRTVDQEWAAAGLAATVESDYDLVLVYGTPGVVDPVEAGLPAVVRRRAHWCGHVTGAPATTAGRPRDLPEPDGRPLVLGAVGGGEDGRAVLDAFLLASAGAPWRAIAVAGPRADASARKALEVAAARAGAAVVPSVRDLARWLPHVDAAVCMGGYNTLVEAAAAATPVVCVPRVRPRTEQLIRARGFERAALLRVVEPRHATPARVKAAIAGALGTDRAELARRVASCLDLGGGAGAATRLLALADRHPAGAVT
jgi:predicted glycosyltransferase